MFSKYYIQYEKEADFIIFHQNNISNFKIDSDGSSIYSYSINKYSDTFKYLLINLGCTIYGRMTISFEKQAEVSALAIIILNIIIILVIVCYFFIWKKCYSSSYSSSQNCCCCDDYSDCGDCCCSCFDSCCNYCCDNIFERSTYDNSVDLLPDNNDILEENEKSTIDV